MELPQTPTKTVTGQLTSMVAQLSSGGLFDTGTVLVDDTASGHQVQAVLNGDSVHHVRTAPRLSLSLSDRSID
jgi:hypothetical protein